MRNGPGTLRHRARCSASGRPQLLDRPLAGCEGLFLPSYARLLVVLAAAQLVHQPRLLALLLEALQSAFEGLVFLDLDTRQKATLPARRPARDASTLAISRAQRLRSRTAGPEPRPRIQSGPPCRLRSPFKVLLSPRMPKSARSVPDATPTTSGCPRYGPQIGRAHV